MDIQRYIELIVFLLKKTDFCCLYDWKFYGTLSVHLLVPVDLSPSPSHFPSLTLPAPPAPPHPPPHPSSGNPDSRMVKSDCLWECWRHWVWSLCQGSTLSCHKSPCRPLQSFWSNRKWSNSKNLCLTIVKHIFFNICFPLTQFISHFYFPLFY